MVMGQFAFVTRGVGYVGQDPDGNGDLVPSYYDDNAEGRVKVGVELIRDENGNLMGVSMQSDDNHVQFCEQHPGPDDIG
jgi:hypothetical protein